MKSKTIKSKVTKFQHQKHYVFVIFFQLICIKQYVIWLTASERGYFPWVWVHTLKVHINKVTHPLYTHFYGFLKNNLNTLFNIHCSWLILRGVIFLELELVSSRLILLYGSMEIFLNFNMQDTIAFKTDIMDLGDGQLSLS